MVAELCAVLVSLLPVVSALQSLLLLLVVFLARDRALED
jgi:hypothetical protein